MGKKLKGIEKAERLIQVEYDNYIIFIIYTTNCDKLYEIPEVVCHSAKCIDRL